MPDLSVIIPARNEPNLQRTIDDLFAKAEGGIEVIPVLDGYWPDPPLKDNPNLSVLHKSVAEGMRPAINDGVRMAKGKYIMKCDAHCLFAPGFDTALKGDCDGDWLCIPTRQSVDPETWEMKGRHFNYHFLTFPYVESMYGLGMHAKTLDWRENKDWNKENEAHEIQDLMTFQGSCWFCEKKNFERLGDLDHEHYYFYQEAQELAFRQWLTGGRVIINKKTWYGHMHKGAGMGRGFYLSLQRKRLSELYAVEFWMNEKYGPYPGQIQSFTWFIDKFWPIQTWPKDWQDEKHKVSFYGRKVVPLHS